MFEIVKVLRMSLNWVIGSQHTTPTTVIRVLLPKASRSNKKIAIRRISDIILAAHRKSFN